MDVFLLSAGKGTRLRPHTEKKPKPLVEVAGKPLIAWNLEAIKKIGSKRVIINTSYLAEQLIDYVGDGSKWELEVIFSYEEELLDTGGGLKNVFEYISSPSFISWNADVFVDPEFAEAEDGFRKLLQLSKSSEAPLISLLVRDEQQEKIEDYGELLIDEDGNLVGFLGNYYGAGDLASEESIANLKRVMFAGITIMSKKVEQYFPLETKFSLTKDIFPAVLVDNSIKGSGKIKVSRCNYYWNDVGTPERLLLASNYMRGKMKSL